MYLAAWLAMRRLLQEDVILHENVGKFDQQILVQALGSHYNLKRVMMSAAELGGAGARERAITICWHKSKICDTLLAWDLVAQLFNRPSTLTYQNLCVATAKELQDDFEWLARRKCSPLKEVEQLPDATHPTSFESALSPVEQDWLAAYRQKWPGRVYQLNQDPVKHAQKSKANGILQTIIRNSYILFMDEQRRCLTPREMLINQGFPLRSSLRDIATGGSQSCSFDKDRVRLRPEVVHQVGNTMHVNMIGAGIMWALAFARRADHCLP